MGSLKIGPQLNEPVSCEPCLSHGACPSLGPCGQAGHLRLCPMATRQRCLLASPHFWCFFSLRPKLCSNYPAKGVLLGSPPPDGSVLATSSQLWHVWSGCPAPAATCSAQRTLLPACWGRDGTFFHLSPLGAGPFSCPIPPPPLWVRGCV